MKIPNAQVPRLSEEPIDDIEDLYGKRNPKPDYGQQFSLHGSPDATPVNSGNSGKNPVQLNLFETPTHDPVSQHLADARAALGVPGQTLEQLQRIGSAAASYFLNLKQ